MLERCTTATFAPLTGQMFRAVPSLGEKEVELVLSRCEESRFGRPDGSSGEGPRVPFSLLFHGPAGGFVAQQTCTLHHPELGEFPLFLVPLGPDANGMRYEAVVS